ncbi:MAG: SH3 domain-containing protein [Acidobacteria bacterium]|nr:SH3 domain-containing protein [Acidobacteriota bacterium]
MKYTIPLILALLSANLFAQEARVVSKDANLRERPTKNSKIVRVVPRGLKLELAEKDGNWYLVSFKNSTGWIHSAAVRFTKERNQTPRKTDKKETDSSPIKALFVGELDNPKLKLQNNSKRDIELDLGGVIFEIKAGLQRTIDIARGSYEYIVTAKGLAPIRGVKRFETKHAYSWAFVIDGDD